MMVDDVNSDGKRKKKAKCKGSKQKIRERDEQEKLEVEWNGKRKAIFKTTISSLDR